MNEELLAKKFGEHHEEVKGLLAKQAEEQRDLRETIRKIELYQAETELTAGGRSGGFSKKTIGQAVAESDQLKALRERGRGSERIKIEGASLSTKAAVLSGDVGSGVLAPDIAEPGVLPQRRLQVRDLFTQGQTTSSSIKFTRMLSRSNSAAPVSESTAKPEQTLSFEIATAEVETIAAWLPASKQILDDSGALKTLIDNELSFAVRYAEESQLLNGDGASPNLYGVIPQATAFSAPFAVTAEQMLDRALQAKGQLEAAEHEPDAYVFNSLDWSRMLALKDDQGRYLYEGGPFSGGPGTLWQLPVIATNSMTVDKFCAGAFRRAGTIFDRQEVTVEISDSHSDYFTRNLIAIRAEERLAFAVQNPGAIVYGDFGNVT